RAGQPVQLRGMSTHGIQWYAGCASGPALDVLADDWRADLLRISMYVQEDGYETDPDRFTELVDTLIGRATARGLYVIVDWHILDPGDPWENLDRARTFFAEIAGRHRDAENIIYEIANEPSDVSWSEIRSYAEQVIPVIRAEDPDAVVLVGTRGWSSLGVSEGADEQEVIDDPVRADNVMYTFHFYAASHGDEYREALSRAADQLPMFVTEFGTQKYTGDGSNDFDSAQSYLDLMAAKQIGWANWNWSDDERSGAVFKRGTCETMDFANPDRLKPAGAWVRDQLRTPPFAGSAPPGQVVA
ncbi:glycoside hydrolase family 5 protein, partial [Asanoa sp. NPDC050611]|uniref:glycoside hydrolase family 5 protein n=1 Tax=Asanoa sp. NPDC050611 TaxID=3157098 RepID=UPI0033F9DFF3